MYQPGWRECLSALRSRVSESTRLLGQTLRRCMFTSPNIGCRGLVGRHGWQNPLRDSVSNMPATCFAREAAPNWFSISGGPNSLMPSS